MNSDNIQLKGMLSIEKYNAENKLIEKIEVPNLVVTIGKTYVASRMIKNTSDTDGLPKMSHMAIGTNTNTDPLRPGTTPALTDTTLNAQLARVGGTPETFSSSVSSNIVTYSATFGPADGQGSIAEAGIFNALTGGTMLCRTTFPVITKDADEAVVITWNISVG